MEQTIKIKDVSLKESQKGKQYWEVQTDKGRMTCHEESIVKELKKCDVNDVYAGVETFTSEDGKWVNIRKFLGARAMYSPNEEAIKIKQVAPNEYEEVKVPSVEVKDFYETVGLKLVELFDYITENG